MASSDFFNWICWWCVISKNVPGDQAYLRIYRRKWNEPMREGTYNNGESNSSNSSSGRRKYHLIPSKPLHESSQSKEREGGRLKAYDMGESEEKRPEIQVQKEEISERDAEGPEQSREEVVH